MSDAIASEALDAFMQEGSAQAAQLLHLLANQNRLLMLCLLVEHGELSVGALVEKMPLSQSALSQHLAVLRKGELVDYRRDAQTLYYFIADANVEKIIATLKDLFCPSFDKP